MPAPGEVTVRVGQRVDSFDVIGRVTLPEAWSVIDVARQLGLRDPDLGQVVLKKEGEPVEAGEIIAEARSGIVGRRQCRAPASGIVVAIGQGWVVLETQPRIEEVRALLHGQVAQVIPRKGAVIEALGATLEGACGLGGEAYGVLQVATESPEATLEAKDIVVGMHGSILIGGRTITGETLHRAEEMRVSGIVVGSIDSSLLALDPLPEVAVIAMEGFGNLPMAPSTYETLTALAGREASILGLTPSGHKPARPLLLALSDEEESPVESQESPVAVGSQVRALRPPLQAREGIIAAIPATPQATELGLHRWGAEVAFAEGFQRFVPWHNLEQII
ncbi:MAG: hypothetical protein ACE5H9_06210 [Anaerolineae bacterium]